MKNFFHGDIKPENLFYARAFNPRIRSDAGTLLYLGSDCLMDTPRYIVTKFTPGFASDKHVEAIKN